MPLDLNEAYVGDQKAHLNLLQLCADLDPSLFDSLMRTLFANEPLPSLNRIQKHQETPSYLSRLSHMGVMAVSAEPDRLRAEQLQIGVQMEDLAFTHFGTFTSGAKSIESMHEEIEKLVDSANKVEESLPQLSAACQDFCHRVKGISKSRKVNHKTLRQHTQLLELLEMAQLMDACVQNEHYEEALEIQQHSLRLASQHHDIPIVRMVAEEIKESTSAMQRQLHTLLSGAVTLPTCLRLIGFLRRLGLYSDFELRIVYLQCRSAFLNEKLSLIPSTNAYAYISKVVDLTRAQLSEVITQYRAIFDQDEDASLSLSSSQGANGSTSSGAKSEELSSILQCWFFHQIDTFLHTLEEKLPSIQDGTSLSNLLSQCMYFGLSMGRLGADFRNLLSPIFEANILQLIRTQLSMALEIFSLQLKRYRPVLSLAPISSSNILSSTPSSSDPASSSDSASNTVPQSPATPSSRKAAVTAQLNPPLAIMDFMPLAHLLNLFAGALNELRKCCPYTLAPTITAAFEAALIGAIDRLAIFRSQMEGDSEQDKACFNALCTNFSEHLLPHVLVSYDTLWKSNVPLLPEDKIREKLSLLFL